MTTLSPHRQRLRDAAMASRQRDLDFMRQQSPALAARPLEELADDWRKWSEKWAGASWVKATRTTVGVFEWRGK